ncbi:hypothetical protein [Paenibacillus sp. NEAU-GSW1]|uniref:hypothetical protein n=1 Tax=Paenibacillus sp. NEAU-GSW1 TaxID=2682486 RepID=UPI0012E1D80F|nr:hypothetical protein [Paenibacillus sp. NEAU-GSW1]MUT67897.1 hypothetical protein [Paenibacillus sp. NEAU-GSW1]
MTTKTATVSSIQPSSLAAVKRLVNLMTGFAWTALTIGVLLCLIKLGHFSEENVLLMLGIGCMVGSVFIFVIGTAIGLVHARMSHQLAQQHEQSEDMHNRL